MAVRFQRKDKLCRHHPPVQPGQKETNPQALNRILVHLENEHLPDIQIFQQVYHRQQQKRWKNSERNKKDNIVHLFPELHPVRSMEDFLCSMAFDLSEK